MVPYALALGATTFQVGLLSSARNLLLSLVQLGSSWVIARAGSRRAVVVWTAALQIGLWLPLAGLRPLLGDHAVLGLIVLYTGATTIAALGLPAWGSLVADYTPERERGRFLGRRARIWGIWSSVASLAAGGVLQLTQDRPLLGFELLALAAGLLRAASYDQLRRLHEDPMPMPPGPGVRVLRALRHLRRNNLARFGLCFASANLAAFVAAPYFTVYILQERGLGYAAYTVIVLAGSSIGFVAAPWWGRVGDRLGNQAVMRWTMFGVALLPAGWLVFPSAIGLALWNALGSFLWSGLNLCATNFLYDAVSVARRHTSLAYFNVLNGIGVAIGALLGGVALEHLPPLGESRFATVFVASVLLRLATAVVFRQTVREVRSVPHVRLPHLVLDLVGQRLVQVVDLFAPSPEVPLRRRWRPRSRPRLRDGGG